MEVMIVSIKELTDPKVNPTLCLSTLRVFNKCHQCPVYKRHKLKGWKVKCKPNVSPDIIELFDEKKALLIRLKEINDSLGARI